MISRRGLLVAVASGLATIGLTGLSGVAANAAKTYTVCKTKDIPVKGGTTFKVAERQILITQPKKGTFKAFAAVCTHQGGALNGAKNNSISCPLHGAKFDATSGAVTSGPASSPLPKVTASVSGTSVRVRF